MTTDCAHYEDENDDSELSIQAGPLKHVLHKSLCESPVLYDSSFKITELISSTIYEQHWLEMGL